MKHPALFESQPVADGLVSLPVSEPAVERTIGYLQGALQERRRRVKPPWLPKVRLWLALGVCSAVLLVLGVAYVVNDGRGVLHRSQMVPLPASGSEAGRKPAVARMRGKKQSAQDVASYVRGISAEIEAVRRRGALTQDSLFKAIATVVSLKMSLDSLAVSKNPVLAHDELDKLTAQLNMLLSRLDSLQRGF